MLVLFDRRHAGPARSPFSRATRSRKTKDLGWDTLSNGELLKVAEEAGFEVLVTTDKNIRYQQNLSGRKIALVVLGNPRWLVVRLYVQRVVNAVNAATPGSFTEVDIPDQ